MDPALEDADERDPLFRHSPVSVPAAMLEMPSMRLTPNNALATLLRLDEAEMRSLNLVDLVFSEDWPIVENLLAGVASGLIESCQGRGRLRPPRGEELDVVGWVRPVDGSRPCPRAVLAVVPAEGALPLATPWFARVDTKPMVFGALDHDWRFSEISPDATELLGWNLEHHRGSPLQRVVHPDDVPLLLLSLGRSGAERRAVASRLRVRGPDDEWTAVRCAFSPLCDHNPPRFGFGLWLLSGAHDVELASDRASRLEGHLWRIAAEIQAAEITDLPKNGETWWADPVLRGLTDRQSQILRRLINGERVPAIGRALFLSESTVRNHLSAIFRKVGVHSQSELLTRLIGRPAPA